MSTLSPLRTPAPDTRPADRAGRELTYADGWCDVRGTRHDGRVMHLHRPSCHGFVSDAELTRQLLVDARDARTTFAYPSGATTPEAAYVAEHRPDALA